MAAMERAAALKRGSLSRSAVQALYGERISMSASRVERLRSCHFAYFMEYGLKAKARRAAAFDAPQIGTFLHYLLEHVTKDVLDRGGQCRRVVYTPGQSTWAAMRYTGEYQIRRSREEELTIELGLAGCFPAFPGDTVRLELEAMGLSGEYRVAEAENTASPETGEVCTLILRERI